MKNNLEPFQDRLDHLQVVNLPVDVSQTVKKGDLLVQLDPEDEKRSVKRAEVALAVSQAHAAQAKWGLEAADRSLQAERIRVQAALRSAEAGENEAKAKLERARHLSERKLDSREELAAAQTAWTQAAADLENARARAKDLEAQELNLRSRRQDIKIAPVEHLADTVAMARAVAAQAQG